MTRRPLFSGHYHVERVPIWQRLWRWLTGYKPPIIRAKAYPARDSYAQRKERT